MAADKLGTFDWNLTPLNVGTTLCTNSYDTLAADANWPQSLTSPASSGPAGFGGLVGRPIVHDVGRGRPVHLNVQVTAALTASVGAATLEVDFIDADDGPLTVNKTVVIQSPAVAKATLVAGYMFPFKTLPRKATRQFIGVQYVVATNNFDGGTISAWLSTDSGGDNADIIGGAP